MRVFAAFFLAALLAGAAGVSAAEPGSVAFSEQRGTLHADHTGWQSVSFALSTHNVPNGAYRVAFDWPEAGGIRAIWGQWNRLEVAGGTATWSLDVSLKPGAAPGWMDIDVRLFPLEGGADERTTAVASGRVRMLVSPGGPNVAGDPGPAQITISGVEFSTALAELDLRAGAHDFDFGSGPRRHSAADLSQLRHMAHLTELNLESLGISDLSPLAGLTGLVELRLGGNPDISSLAPLAGLANLRRLSLWGANSFRNWEPDEGRFVFVGAPLNLSPLSGLSRLESLDLTTVNFGSLAPLSSLSNLNELFIGTNVGFGTYGAIDIYALSGLRRLETLHISGQSVSDLSPVGEMLGLRHLQAMWMPELADIEPIGRLIGLWSLDIGGDLIADISPLAGLAELTHLTVSGENISDISPLAGLSNLTELYIWGSRVSELAPLRGHARLERLAITDADISDVSPLSSLRALRALDLSNNRISNIAPLASLGNLESLELRDNPVAGANWAAFSRVEWIDIRP